MFGIKCVWIRLIYLSGSAFDNVLIFEVVFKKLRIYLCFPYSLLSYSFHWHICLPGIKIPGYENHFSIRRPNPKHIHVFPVFIYFMRAHVLICFEVCSLMKKVCCHIACFVLLHRIFPFRLVFIFLFIKVYH